MAICGRQGPVIRGQKVIGFCALHYRWTTSVADTQLRHGAAPDILTHSVCHPELLQPPVNANPVVRVAWLGETCVAV